MVPEETPLPVNAPRRASPPLYPGDLAPWFHASADDRARFEFSSAAGRRLVLSFVDSLTHTEQKCVADALLADTQRLVRIGAFLVIVSADPADTTAKVPETVKRARLLFDPDRTVGNLYGVTQNDAYGPTTFILDERLRILAVVQAQNPDEHLSAVLSLIDRLPAPRPARRWRPQAPVLMIPNVFERQFCQQLIDEYEIHGGAESGFMVEEGGKTVELRDHSLKRRSDWTLTDQSLIRACLERVRRRIVPEVQRAFQFTATRIERYLVACYEAESGGHFAPHRDNTTLGTAHRRFAVSINLNDDFDGGNLLFPEFDRTHFLPPIGGACVFSCSLLHEATPVTKGKRYVFVPFLYDEAASAIRNQNRSSLASNRETALEE